MVVKNIDKSNMRKMILDFPKQFEIGIKAAKNVFLEPGKLIRWPENIIICGMGGSALPGEILATLRPLDVFTYKSYRLPIQARNESLIICISYSGDTEETLSSFQEAVEKKLPLISITTDGELEKLSKKYDVPSVKLPGPLIPPRLALGEMFAALIQVLQNHNLFGKELIKEVLKLGNRLKPEKLENQGKNLAKKIKNKIPIIYASHKEMVLSQIWKIKFNEASKIPAYANCFPELNHNEMTGFENPLGKFHVIILRDPIDHPRILKRMRFTAQVIKKKGVNVDIIDIKGKNMLYKIFSNILLADWVSYYLALEYNVDPISVKLQEEFKLWLRSKKQ